MSKLIKQFGLALESTVIAIEFFTDDNGQRVGRFVIKKVKNDYSVDTLTTDNMSLEDIKSLLSRDWLNEVKREIDDLLLKYE